MITILITRLDDPQRASTIEKKVKESVETREWKDEIASNSESIVRIRHHMVLLLRIFS